MIMALGHYYELLQELRDATTCNILISADASNDVTKKLKQRRYGSREKPKRDRCTSALLLANNKSNKPKLC